MTIIQDRPQSEIDLFSDEARLDPYPRYEQLRRLGPVVWLSRHEVYAITTFAEAKAVLTDPELYSSAQGVFMNPGMNDSLGDNIMLCLDPPRHGPVRDLMSAPLTPARMRELRPQLLSEARAAVTSLVAARRFDAASDLAQHLPMTVISQLVGFGEHGRENMLRWAGATWEAQGVPNERAVAAEPVIGEFIEFARTEAVPGNLVPGGWAAQLYEAADEGRIDRAECPMLMLDYVTPSLDTTIFAISSAIALFAAHPDEWTALRRDPGLISSAINEVLRVESPVQQFSRVATRPHELGGAQLEAGDRVLVLFGSANRDESQYPDAARFDVARHATDQLAFGVGEHSCIGMQLARIEMDAVLRSLVEQVERFDVVEATLQLSNVLRGYEKLVVDVVPA